MTESVLDLGVLASAQELTRKILSNFSANCTSYVVIDFETSGIRSSFCCPKITEFALDAAVPHCSSSCKFSGIIHTPYDPAVWGACYLHPRFAYDCGLLGVDSKQLVPCIDYYYGSVIQCPVAPDGLKSLEGPSGKPFYTTAVDVCPNARNAILQDVDEQSVFSRERAISLIAEFISLAVYTRPVLVGHNLYSFDLPQLIRELNEHKSTFSESLLNTLDSFVVIDTGLIIKASLCGVEFRPTDTLFDFYTRVINCPCKSKWSLDLVAASFLPFLSGNPSCYHTAAFDTLTTKFLYMLFCGNSHEDILKLQRIECRPAQSI